jgi:4-amino-4-deoxy-L-arabinose transferase-like glycosyltransferase
MSELIASRRATLLAFGLIGMITLWRVAILAVDSPNLSFDEAQYWAWAQHIQLGYYSKPPMVAWAIAATTALFGEGEGAVKLGSTLAHSGTAIVLVFLGRALFGGAVGDSDGRAIGDSYGRAIGAWAGLAWITLPAVSLSAMIITTDPFLLFFWALALLCLVEARRAGPRVNRWWVMLGLAFGLGLLSKYAMAFFAVSVGLWLVWDREARPLAKAPGLWLAGGLGLLVYAPNAVWNAANGFVSYAHTKDNANLGVKLFNPDKLAEFIGGQFAVAGPILMVALLAGLVAAFRRPADARLKMLAAFTLPVLAVMTAESFLSRANANWTAPAYVAGIVLAVAMLARRPAWLAASLALHLVVAGGLYNIDRLRVGFGLADSARYDPEKRIKGWDEIGRQVSAVLAAHPGARLLADERKVLATLTYYVRPHPFDAIKWNPGGAIHDHFDQTTRLEPGAGPWIYVTERPDPDAAMAPRFARMESLGEIHVPVHADYQRKVTVWRLDGFTGY